MDWGGFSVAQQLDGIFGPIIVSNEKDQSHRDQIIVISPQMKNFQTFNNGLEADLKVSSLRVEVYDHFRPDNKGKEEEEEEENFIQRTRIVNAAALNCPVTLRSQKLPMKIIAIDGNNVKPKLSREITINPGKSVFHPKI